MSNWDKDILLWINSHYTDVLDELMWLVSGRLTWIPLYVLMLGVLLYHVSTSTEDMSLRVGRWQWRLAQVQCLLLVLTIVALVVFSDQTCHWLKHWIARPRPSHAPELEGLIRSVRGYTGGMYGHPSSHAANTMALAVFFLSVFRSVGRKNTTFIFGVVLMVGYVSLNCYSRMYLGVHYPSDILFGLIIGALLGGLASAALRRLFGVVCRLACSQSGHTDWGSESS